MSNYAATSLIRSRTVPVYQLQWRNFRGGYASPCWPLRWLTRFGFGQRRMAADARPKKWSGYQRLALGQRATSSAKVSQ